MGAQARPRAADRHRHPGRDRRHRSPTAQWRARPARARRSRASKRRKVASCGISDKRPWSVGDNINLSVGQGDLQAIAAADGDRLRRDRQRRPRRAPAPRAWPSRTPAGSEIQRIRRRRGPQGRDRPGHRQAILDGLHLATQADGTSAEGLRRTGTRTASRSSARPARPSASRAPTSPGTSRYVPHPTQADRRSRRPSRTAASAPTPPRPIACRMLATWFDQRAHVRAGRSRTN